VELGELLENHWSKLMQKCEEYALAGNIKEIKKTLGELIGLYSRRNKIGDLLRVSFHVRIKTLSGKKDFKAAEAIIYSYIDIFGIDSEISEIMKKFEKSTKQKLAISEAQFERPRRDKWRDFDTIMKVP
jgi:ABC-type multidrug transport system ATPase subunit